MTKKKYQKLTPRALEHVLTWGDVCCKKDSWTKSDTNTYDLIKRAVSKMRHDDYLKRKAVEANPYLEPDQPYHTT